MTEIYLVRHCESEANVSHSYAGRSDVDISEKGAKQLEYLSEAFRNIKLDKVYSTSLKRALKTAEAINKYPQAPIEIEDDFIEIDFGIFDGKPVSVMPEEFRNTWFQEYHNYYSPKGESVDEVCERVMRGLKKVSKENDGKTIAIASHGCAIRCLMRQLMGLPREKGGEVAWCDNTGINKIIFQNGEFKIEVENETAHLPDDFKAEPISSWGKE